MKNRDNIYNVGNDYFQKVEDYFVTSGDVSGKSPIYSDGLYHYTQKPVYELSGGEYALNKRVFNKLPQSDWAAPEVIPADVLASAFSAAPDASALFSPDYAKVELDTDTDNTWSGTPKAKKD